MRCYFLRPDDRKPGGLANSLADNLWYIEKVS